LSKLRIALWVVGALWLAHLAALGLKDPICLKVVTAAFVAPDTYDRLAPTIKPGHADD
jgi:hypothetical protein